MLLSADAILIGASVGPGLDSHVSVITEIADPRASQADAQISYQPSDPVADMFAGMSAEALSASSETAQKTSGETGVETGAFSDPTATAATTENDHANGAAESVSETTVGVAILSDQSPYVETAADQNSSLSAGVSESETVAQAS